MSGVMQPPPGEVLHESPRSFCDLVAISYDLVVMGRIGAVIGPSPPGQERRIPVPEIDDPMPFPRAVRFVALRCFEAALFFGAPGRSCVLPEVPVPNETNRTNETNGTNETTNHSGVPSWIQRRIQEYLDVAVALVANSTGNASERAMDVIPKALRAAGLESRLPGEDSEDSRFLMHCVFRLFGILLDFNGKTMKPPPTNSYEFMIIHVRPKKHSDRLKRVMPLVCVPGRSPLRACRNSDSFSGSEGLF